MFAYPVATTAHTESLLFLWQPQFYSPYLVFPITFNLIQNTTQISQLRSISASNFLYAVLSFLFATGCSRTPFSTFVLLYVATMYPSSRISNLVCTGQMLNPAGLRDIDLLVSYRPSSSGGYGEGRNASSWRGYNWWVGVEMWKAIRISCYSHDNQSQARLMQSSLALQGFAVHGFANSRRRPENKNKKLFHTFPRHSRRF